MMSLEKLEGNRIFSHVFRLSFLEKDKLFLKRGVDLNNLVIGEDLDSLISLNWDEMDGMVLDGMVLDKNTIPVITKKIYESISSIKDENLKIKENQVNLIVYTLCQIEEMLLFLVWDICPYVVVQSKNAWENRYSLPSNECCKKNYLGLLVENKDAGLARDVIELQTESLNSLIQKNCKYKESHLECQAIVNSHLVNLRNRKALETFFTNPFNTRIDSDFVFGMLPSRAFFFYGGVENRLDLSCSFFYDSIVYENRGNQIQEHNFQNFVSDSLYTCLHVQNDIGQPNFKTKENRLLYMSVYL